jgi:hypothetical protein
MDHFGLVVERAAVDLVAALLRGRRTGETDLPVQCERCARAVRLAGGARTAG